MYIPINSKKNCNFGTFFLKNCPMKKFIPHIIAIVSFLVITFAYLSPVFSGKDIFGGDTQSYIGMAQEANTYNANHDDQTLWTGSMFSGMPTYQICMKDDNSVISLADDALRVLPGPTYRVFLYLVGFYILLIAFGLSPYWAIAGSIAFAFGSYNLIIIVAGHNTKAVAIAYMAPIIASIYLGFKKEKPYLGATLLALFLGLGLYANHIQIIYYTLFIAIIFGISEIVFTIKEKTFKKFFTSIGFLCLGAILAVGLNATRLITTAEYSKHTMRGDSNGLTIIESGDKHGLDLDYITAWSYGIDETLTLLIPDFKGGSSHTYLDADSHTAQKMGQITGFRDTGKDLSSTDKERLARTGNPKNLAELMYIQPMPTYWGTQPFTSGPVYAGAIVCFLFIVGCIIVPNRQRYWLITATILGILLSWGHNFMPFTEFFVNFVPLYDKFRTVSMTLTISCLCMVILAFLAIKELTSEKIDTNKKLKSLYIGAGVTGGLCLLFAIIPSLAGDFSAASDNSYGSSYSFLTETLPQDRMAMLQSDALRSLIFIALAFALLFFFVKGKIKTVIASVTLIALCAADMIPVAYRYLNERSFVKKEVRNKPFTASEADKYILADKTEDFRVLNLTVDVFNSSAPSYFHKNVGGYSAVKLRRYQELIEVHISKEIRDFTASLRTISTLGEAEEIFKQTPVLNMLNTKYLIYSPQAIPISNPYKLGNAWLVNNVDFVNSADEEMLSLGLDSLTNTVIVDKSTENAPVAKKYNSESGKIELIKYEPNAMTYKFSSTEDQLAVFSEIYYPDGWNAYINGEIVSYFRANYLLRAMELKAGDYEIEFRFEPKSYDIGKILSIICSILLTTASVYIIFAHLKNNFKR